MSKTRCKFCGKKNVIFEGDPTHCYRCRYTARNYVSKRYDREVVIAGRVWKEGGGLKQYNADLLAAENKKKTFFATLKEGKNYRKDVRDIHKKGKPEPDGPWYFRGY